MLYEETMIWETPEETDLKLADRIRNLRKRRQWSQEKLSERSGVSLGSLKRFENSGKISLLSFTRLIYALDAQSELQGLLTHVPYRDIQEVINERR